MLPQSWNIYGQVKESKAILPTVGKTENYVSVNKLLWTVRHKCWKYKYAFTGKSTYWEMFNNIIKSVLQKSVMHCTAIFL